MKRRPTVPTVDPVAVEVLRATASLARRMTELEGQLFEARAAVMIATDELTKAEIRALLFERLYRAQARNSRPPDPLTGDEVRATG
jgi:type II secretory pathway predicted ATPase ExeA